MPTRIRGLRRAVSLIVLAGLAAPAPLSAQGDTIRAAYVSHPTERQYIALSTPAARGFPTVLFVHGGSLTSGSPNEPRYVAICRNLVRAGVACGRVGYRLAHTAKWPAQPQDLAAAIAWTRQNIARYGGDPGRIYLFGHSAGCLLSTLIVSDTTYLNAVHLSPNDVAGVIAMGCLTTPFDTAGRGLTLDQLRTRFAESFDDQLVYTRVEDRLAANPSAYVGPHLPPIRFFIAEGERFQPPILEQNARFVRRAREFGVDADLRIMAGREHETAIDSLVNPADPVWEPLLAFFRGARGRTP